MYIRPIEYSDDSQVAELIRSVLTEFGANRPGFAWQDPELEAMTDAYRANNRVYKVIEVDGAVVGAGGIGPFKCTEYEACCELQKMYLYPQFRGQGAGRMLIEELLGDARKMRYEYCYLESLSSMHGALNLYRKQGFINLDQPLGSSGHNSCDEWMLLDLNAENCLK